MYWYKSTKKYIIYTSVLLLLCGSYACNKPEIKETGAQLKYFDLKGYFDKEAERLQILNPQINKSVSHNGETETKKVRISSWKKELNMFTESDINKPAWKASYSVFISPNTPAEKVISYKAKYPDLKTQNIFVAYSNGELTEIQIVNNVKNLLYQTTETLYYSPKHGYTIIKTQKVKIMGANNYRIKGVF
jgi:hypothetical protein